MNSNYKTQQDAGACNDREALSPCTNRMLKQVFIVTTRSVGDYCKNKMLVELLTMRNTLLLYVNERIHQKLVYYTYTTLGRKVAHYCSKLDSESTSFLWYLKQHDGGH